MTVTNNIPLDNNGKEMFGNPDRMRAIGKELVVAHDRLTTQRQEVDDDLNMITFTDKRNACPSTHLTGPDADLATLILRAQPPTFRAAGLVQQTMKTMATAAKTTAVNAWNITVFAGDLDQADARFRDEMANLPHDLTVSYRKAEHFQESAAASYADVRKVLAEKEWDSADKSVLDQNHHEQLATFFAGVKQYCDANADKCKTDPALTDPYAIAQHLGVGPDGKAAPGGDSKGGGDDGVNFGSANWFGRQMQDMFGVIPRDGAAILSWGGHMVADTGDLVWDAGWGVGKFAVNTVWDVGASLVHGNTIITDMVTGKVSPGEGLSDLLDQQWHDAGETLGNVGTFFKDEGGNIADWGKSIGHHTWSGVKDIGDGFVDFVNPWD